MRYHEIIRDETNRALWEVENVISCIPDNLWDKLFCEMPLWKHVYHMLHSLDQWFINPKVYKEPPFHEKDLNNLDAFSHKALNRKEMSEYFIQVKRKIEDYLTTLTEEMLLGNPEHCEWERFTLIMAQHRHLHTHMGILMGFLIGDTGRWPFVLGLTRPIPDRGAPKFF